MKKRFSGPQIAAKLRQADVLTGQGKTVPEVCREIEISQQTYYRWRMDYNHYRSHSSLRFMAPAVFSAKCLEKSSAPLRLAQDIGE